MHLYQSRLQFRLRRESPLPKLVSYEEVGIIYRGLTCYTAFTAFDELDEASDILIFT